MISHTIMPSLLVLACALACAQAQRMPFKGCAGNAKYSITFRNFIKAPRYGPSVPSLVFSPVSGVSHSNRASILTVRGYANPAISAIAKTGNNTMFIALGEKIKKSTGLVYTVAAASGPTLSGKSSRIMLKVDCMRPFVTVVAMIAPSPDWIVQINNMNLFNPMDQKFISRVSGNLIAYDAGVDDGADFTDPGDASLDIPTNPVLNIAPLSEDETDPFGGRLVGRYIIRRIM